MSEPIQQNLTSMVRSLAFTGISGAYWLLHPKERPRITWQSEGLWKVYDIKSGEVYHVPSKDQTHRGHRRRRRKTLQKYTLEEFVEVEPEDTVVDVGAFIGEFSISACELGATVHALEPTPVSFRCLVQNTTELDSVIPHQVGIWKEDTTINFSIAENQTENSVLDVDAGEVTEEIAVNVKTIESFLKENNVGSVDFLKVEAEGAEPEVLKGSVGADFDKIAVDAGAERYGEETADSVSDILIQDGYEVRRSGSMVFGRISSCR